LEKLKFSFLFLTEGTLQLISKYLMNDSRILHLGFKQCSFGFVGTPKVMPSLALLAAGFMANTTLESVLFSAPIDPYGVRDGSMEDGEVAILLRGLISHPKLQSLEVTKHNCGAETMEALHRIFAVASSTRTGTRHFKHLILSDCPSFDMESFVKLLQPSNRACAPTTTTTATTAMTMPTVPSQSPYWCPLQCLDLSWNMLTSTCANMLLRTLLKSGQCCPNLERVILCFNNITDWGELTKDLLPSRTDQEQHCGTAASKECFRCPVRVLDLDLNRCLDQHFYCDVSVFKLLEAFPTVRFLGEEFSDAFERYTRFPRYRGSVAEFWDWRRCGGGAFPPRVAHEDQEIPLSLWPLILAKGRQYDDELWRQAAVLYGMLHEYGTAFVRGSSE
jgi:hypothetical protein